MITIPNIRQIDAAARQFLEKAGKHRVFAFYGEMGAGKTTFIKALCRAMEVKDTVSSPSFALIYEYFSAKYGNIYHFDLYRIREITELFDLGYEDYFYGNGYCFIEWPEKAEALLPPGTVPVKIHVNDDGSRTLEIDPSALT